MNSKKVKVLLCEGLARQVLPMSKSLRDLGCEVTTYNTSKLDPGYASKHPHRKILGFFDIKEPEKTYAAIKSELESYHYDLVIPMNDDVAILLSKHKEDLKGITEIAVNDWDTIQYSIDKLKTMKICMENNLPCPQTFNSREEFTKAKNIKYPLVVKPRTACGAVGFYVGHDYESVLAYINSAEKKFGPCLIQEYIPQDDVQYKCEIFIDSKGEMKGACVFAKVRWYPINGGSSCLNKIVDRPDIINDCQKLLKLINWKGYADIDLIQDPRDGKAKIMEINPRITGSVKICFKAGINFSKMIIDDFNGEDVQSQFDVNYDTYLRYMHTDILWFLKSKERFSCTPSWFSFKNTVDQIFSWDDLWVSIAYTIQGFKKLIADKKKRNI